MMNKFSGVLMTINRFTGVFLNIELLEEAGFSRIKILLYSEQFFYALLMLSH